MTDFGTISGFPIPGLTSQTGWTQDYLNDYDYTAYTGTSATISYLGIGGSRLSELKKYGTTGYTQPVTGGTDSVGSYTAYTFTYTAQTGTTGTTTLYYRDYDNGQTLITGTTSGFTKEEVYENTLTRNEHFLGFLEQPQIYSDVFVERGKQGVMERNLRLGEINNIGELSIYGNGYFKIQKQ